MPTIGVEFKNKFLKIKNKTLKLYICDTSGNEKYRSITYAHYKSSHGIIIAYDITKYG